MSRIHPGFQDSRKKVGVQDFPRKKVGVQDFQDQDSRKKVGVQDLTDCILLYGIVTVFQEIIHQ